LQCVAECCSVLQSVAVCCRVLQCVAECCSVTSASSSTTSSMGWLRFVGSLIL